MKTELAEIYNFRDVDQRLATGGQPTEAQLQAAAVEGFQVVINLALHDDPRYSLNDEAGCVRSAGMEYVHIPVPFAAPTERDLLAFFSAMDAHKDKKVLVHCAANKRVTAFLGLYRVLKDGWPPEDAFRLMNSVWQPDEVWKRFIASMIPTFEGYGRNISHDGDNVIDWGKTRRDYAQWRPNYPERFFQSLALFGVGLPGQRMLDLGTGIGFLALRFAQAGASVVGVDISEEQLSEARQQADALGLGVQFNLSRAEETGLPSASFDVITAGQSWLYFDKERIIPEVKRLLKPGGVLMTSHLSWLPRQDAIARASEALVLKHNPTWSAADFSGEIPVVRSWAQGHFQLHAMFVFDEAMPFTRESWRGRIRACRGVGATLAAEQVEAFDREHEALLKKIAPDEFTVLHRIDAHILRPARNT